jgi:hypothetical protein
MDKIGREIQANDIVLLMQGKNSRLVLCRGGLTASGLVRGINLELTNGNLNKMTFKSTNCIILERPQIISQLELQIEKVETVYNRYIENTDDNRLVQDYIRARDSRTDNLRTLIDILDKDGNVRDNAQHIKFRTRQR